METLMRVLWGLAVRELAMQGGKCVRCRLGLKEGVDTRSTSSGCAGGSVYFKIVASMGVDERELGAGLTQGAVTTVSFPLLKDCQGTMNGDEIGRE